ncbi:hypothetical protein LSTR_LSTR008803 [Laodelphax striatellus]|uniref:Uncharacterized protein n=1 Tax=Laodelphax striatellus TaxID=195883 RepID=A0A482X3R3_LAOST|nr:hypothetical protein LSTR_LSTR008803 [Laodelphax striatellus]
MAADLAPESNKGSGRKPPIQLVLTHPGPGSLQPHLRPFPASRVTSQAVGDGWSQERWAKVKEKHASVVQCAVKTRHGLCRQSTNSERESSFHRTRVAIVAELLWIIAVAVQHGECCCQSGSRRLFVAAVLS